jgi:hypothetical protein
MLNNKATILALVIKAKKRRFLHFHMFGWLKIETHQDLDLMDGRDLNPRMDFLSRKKLQAKKGRYWLVVLGFPFLSHYSLMGYLGL